MSSETMVIQGYSRFNTKEKQTNKIMKCKNPNNKTQHHNEYKQYRNWLSTFIKRKQTKILQ